MMNLFLGFWVLIVQYAQLSSCNEEFRLPECGKIDEIPGDPRTKAPWVAGIFSRASSYQSFEFLVTGTILDAYTVLTVLGGVYGQTSAKGRKYSIPSAQNHRIVVGLSSTDWESLDEHSQVMEVSYILPFNGEDPENKQFHFFLFKLKNPLNLTTPYVRSACVPFFAEHLPSATYGRRMNATTLGFVSPNNDISVKKKYLKISGINLEDKTFCDEKFSEIYNSSAGHIYCGRLPPEQSTECTSYGTAAVFPLYHSQWFIVGILALHPRTLDQPSWCSKNTTFFYGRLLKALEWILENFKCKGSEFSCGEECISLDKVCDTKADCEDKRDEDAIYCRARRPCLSSSRPFECGVYGPCLKKEKTCDGKKDCPDGEDEGPQTCGGEPLQAPGASSNDQQGESSAKLSNFQQSEVTRFPEPAVNGDSVRLKCPPLKKSEGLIINCTDGNDVSVSCDQAPPGATARLQCQPRFVSTDDVTSRVVMTCKEDGSWNPFRTFKCKDQCGILHNNRVQPYIVQGQPTTRDKPFPWHTAIFAKKNNEFSFICGGSLIEKNIVVTVGHCLTDASGTKFPKDTLKVVLGGNSSILEINERTSEVQIFDVKNIWVPATFNRRTLKSDIGLIEFDRDAKYGEYVRPVCYLLNVSNTVPSPGTLGLVPAYGYKEDKKISEYLHFASFPVITPRECSKSLQKPPPSNTFCAGYKNGTSVCQGDSGGGMVFLERGAGLERYVLRGLVSHGDVKIDRICDPRNYAVFTHVDAYADWILSKVESIVKR